MKNKENTLKSINKERTICRLDFTYTSLNEKGDEIIKNKGSEKIHFMLLGLMEMLKYYSEQGEILKFNRIVKLLLQFEHFNFIDKIRLFLNKIAMILMIDKDRKKFLQDYLFLKTRFLSKKVNANQSLYLMRNSPA